ncbi:hypothetical protein L2E82_36373 [Cichorium intybus]|uniref:Uncharacterized protein n=1 Tax=Cichorium intybus TaxID=13427 RepID=A0ACB9BRB2_CICIN|nr:hypothetical protein L2E82_36373 [Cichorium intybus]
MNAPLPRRQAAHTIPRVNHVHREKSTRDGRSFAEVLADDWSPFRECPFDKTEETDDEIEEDEDEDSEGISDTWDGMKDDREEGEFIPSDKVNFPAPVSSPEGNCEGAGRSPKDVSENGDDSMSVERQDEKVEESVGNNVNACRIMSTGVNARGDCNCNNNEKSGGPLDPTNSPSVGSDKGGPPGKDSSKEMGQTIKSNGLLRQTRNGGLDASPSGADPTSVNKINSPPTADSSKSSVGRAKRRRIRKRGSPGAVGKDYVTQSHRC